MVQTEQSTSVSALTRQDLVEQFQVSLGVPKADAARLLEDLISLIKEAAISHDGLKVAGFGSFEARYKKERTGRNPKTQSPVQIKQRWVFVFRPSASLRARLTQRGGDG